LALSPIVITGNKRDKALNRALNLEHFKFDNEPDRIIRLNDYKEGFPLSLTVPYRPWLHEASLYFNEKRIGCACGEKYDHQYAVFTPILPPVFNPQYQVAYITPPVVPVKRVNETYSARLNFELNRYKILRNFKNNAQVLDEVDKIINEIRNDNNLTVTEFLVTGYASPEGNPQHNMKLSENRARAFVTYLRDQFGITPSMIKVDWKGEDWEGLKNVVKELSIQDKDAVISLIDNETNVMARKNKLHQLSGGQTYRMLLRDYYPALRRNEYTISYIARGFTVDEAKELIKTKPQQLSLNEMFLVANSYPKNSSQFKEVFDIAVRQYPNDNIAQMNKAALDIETGNFDSAIATLLKVNTPEAWNNLGIAYLKKNNDYRQAEQYFKRAADAGLESARTNAQQLSQWMSSQQPVVQE